MDKRPDGSPAYGLPMIYDPKTKKGVADARVIAQYLDDTYPDTPKLLPENLKAGIDITTAWVWDNIIMPLIPLIVPQAYHLVNPGPNKDYFRASREMFLGAKLEDVSPPEKREAQWVPVKAALNKLAGWMDQNGPDKPFVFGDQFTYADCFLIGFLAWPMIVGRDEDWEAITTWDNGRWGKLMKIAEQYGVYPKPKDYKIQS